MFNMLNEGFNKKFLYESQLEPIEKEIKKALKNAGYNVDSEDADNYIESAAEYIDYSRTIGGDTNYSVKQWLADTEMNYPEDLSFMKESLTEADEVEEDDIDSDDVDNAFIDDISFDDVDDEQSLNYDDSEEKIDIEDEIETDKEHIDDESKPDNLGTFHNDNGNDYKVIERSESGKNALLQRGKQWVIAYNCPESNEGSWGQGHYFFDEEEARKVWEDKYLNESLKENYEAITDIDEVKKAINDGKTVLVYNGDDDREFFEISKNGTVIKDNSHSHKYSSDWCPNPIGRKPSLDDILECDSCRFYLDESLKEDLASYIQKIHDTDEYLWNLHNTDYSWLYDECAKYSDTWGSEDSEDTIADCIRKMPKEKQYEILDKLVAPYNESLNEGVMTGYWCPACHDKSLQSTLMVVDDERQDGAEVLECDSCGKRFFRSKKDNEIKPLPEYVKVRRFDEAFDVNDRKAKSEVINWWKSVEKWNRENGSKYNIDNDYNDVESMFTAMYDMFRELKNSNPELYKNGKSIYNKYATHPIKESKGNKPMRIIKEDYNQKLRESIRKIVFRLTEAEMSDEDKRDTEILRNIYKKIDGRKIGKNTFTSEEQEVIDKYGLDVWGYRGDSKVVTGSGRKDVVNSSEYKNSWGRPQQKFDKINYADRARKIDDRDYAQQINRRKGWNQTFDDAEKEMQGWKQSERINQMKRALKDRKYYQNEIDNAEDNLTNRLNRAEADADKKIADANKRMRDETSWARTSRDAAQKSINNILDKHRVKECMNQLKEATSPEDKRESDILRNIYYKMQNRSNAKLTPEEQEVVDKYNLVRTYNKNLKANDTDDYLFKRGEGESRSTWGSTTPNRKINYADRARKLGTRDYAQDINSMNSWDSGKTFRDKERTRINNEMGKDVSDMKDALYNRKYNNERIANAEKDYQNKVAKIEAEKELAKERAKKYSSDNLERSRQKVADANTNIKKLLNKEESLKEDANEKRIVSTGLSGVKNEEILDSVIGQMSDGIWENSPGMDGYWIPANIDGCDIVIDNNQFIKHGADRYGDSKYIDNKYYRKSDDEVRRFFANKIKQITQEYLNDNNLNPYSDWRPDNDEVCDYLDRGSGVTVGDAYKAYKALK